jgi:hypothetical protein
VTRSLLLKQVPASSSLLATQQLERRFYTLFAIVTLRLGSSSQWVYHAVCIKVPKNRFRRLLGLSSNDKEDDKHLPVMLVETTAYTTSNWRYESPYVTVDSYEAITRLADVNSKVSSSIIQKQKLYGHLCSLTSPELLLEDGIGQIQLSHNGKFGVPVNLFVQDMSVASFHVVNASKGDVATCTESEEHLPRTLLLKGGQSPGPRKDGTKPVTEFVIRKRDWDEQQTTIRRLCQQIGTKVDVQHIESYGGIGGVCVTVYA